MTPDYPQILQTVRQTVNSRLSRRDTCIATTKVLVEVCRQMRIKVEPMTVRVQVFNDKLLQLLEKYVIEHNGQMPPSEQFLEWQRQPGVKAIGVGYGVPTAPGKWVGHLVAVTTRSEPNFLLDASSDQCDRPDCNIFLPYVVAPLTASDREKKCLQCDVGSSLVQYELDPKDLSYTISPDWTEYSRTAPMIRQVLDELQPCVGRGFG